MNRTQFFTLGGALLASTAMATVAAAGTIGSLTDSGAGGSGAMSTTTISISNNLFSTTAATANALVFPSAGSLGTARHLAISYTNLFPNSGRTRTFLNVNGALFVTGAVPSVSLLIKNAAGSFIATINAAGIATAICSSVTPIQTQISLIDCGLSTLFTTNLTTALGAVGTLGSASVFFGGILLSGIIFTGAAGLATVGNTITLSGTVLDASNQGLESISSGAIITSAAGVAVPTATAGAAAVANSTTTPSAFLSFIAGPTSVGNGGLTLTLATVNLTNTAAVGTDLATVATAQNQVSGVTISVTSTLLSQSAAVSVSLPVATVPITSTVANFSAGTVTFAIINGNVDGIAAAGVAGVSNAITVTFSGSASIAAAAAGTVTIAAAADGNGSQAGGGAQAQAAGSGTTTVVSQGGFSTSINTFQSSAGGSNFQAFVRIHNNGTNAGTVTITVRNDSTGGTLGTMTTSSIAANGTLQLSAGQIEAGAGITTPSGQYTLAFSGPITGYVQHLMLNGTNNAFSDLSGFRLGAGTNRP